MSSRRRKRSSRVPRAEGSFGGEASKYEVDSRWNCKRCGFGNHLNRQECFKCKLDKGMNHKRGLKKTYRFGNWTGSWSQATAAATAAQRGLGYEAPPPKRYRGKGVKELGGPRDPTIRHIYDKIKDQPVGPLNCNIGSSYVHWYNSGDTGQVRCPTCRKQFYGDAELTIHIFEVHRKNKRRADERRKVHAYRQEKNAAMKSDQTVVKKEESHTSQGEHNRTQGPTIIKREIGSVGGNKIVEEAYTRWKVVYPKKIAYRKSNRWGDTSSKIANPGDKVMVSYMINNWARCGEKGSYQWLPLVDDDVEVLAPDDQDARMYVVTCMPTSRELSVKSGPKWDDSQLDEVLVDGEVILDPPRQGLVYVVELPNLDDAVEGLPS